MKSKLLIGAIIYCLSAALVQAETYVCTLTNYIGKIVFIKRLAGLEFEINMGGNVITKHKYTETAYKETERGIYFFEVSENPYLENIGYRTSVIDKKTGMYHSQVHYIGERLSSDEGLCEVLN